MTFARLARLAGGLAASVRGMTWQVAAACLLAVLSFAAVADDDLPGRVGRVADAAGGLFLSPEDQATQWTEIGINYPITSGDNLWASAGGRAEVDYGGGQFRLAGATNIHVSRLDDRQLALFVAQGQLIVRIRALDPGEAVRIDAPTAQMQLTRTGLYRIDVLPERQTTIVTIREGEALVALASGVQRTLPGQTVTITGQDPAVAELRNGVGLDGFDTWSANRDRYYERSRSTAYVSRQMVGAAELDEYGAWQTYPDYGPVWFPNAVAADWAPYRDGYWTTVGAWGATWVDAAPWGYAPFHYGRWASIGGRWGWCPGSFVARPVWAPALVAWHGGPGWAVSASYGAPVYGWVPLGWREPYLPPWRGCSTRCWTQHNQPYAVDVRERPRTVPATYVNMAVPGAVTAVLGTTLTGARPVAANRVPLPLQTASAAPALGAAPPVNPGRTPPPAGNAGSLPPPAVLLHPQRVRTASPETNVGATARQPPAAAAGGTAPGVIAAPTGGRPVPPPRQAPQPVPPQYRVAVPQAPTPDAPGRVVETPVVRPGSQPSPSRAAPGAVPQGASVAAPQAVPQQVDGGTTGAAAPPVRPPPVQRVDRGTAMPAAPAVPVQRVDRGTPMPAASTRPAQPAAVAVPAPQAAPPAGAAPQTNLVRPAGRASGPNEPAPTGGPATVPVAPAPAPGAMIK